MKLEACMMSDVEDTKTDNSNHQIFPNSVSDACEHHQGSISDVVVTASVQRVVVVSPFKTLQIRPMTSMMSLIVVKPITIVAVVPPDKNIIIFRRKYTNNAIRITACVSLLAKSRIQEYANFRK